MNTDFFNVSVYEGMTQVICMNLLGKTFAAQIYGAIVTNLAQTKTEAEFEELDFTVNKLTPDGDWMVTDELDELAFGLDKGEPLTTTDLVNEPLCVIAAMEPK